MPVLKINDIDLYYEQEGVGEDLILIGGLTSDSQVWKSALRILSKHFRVLIFDNRGAGKSSVPDYPYTTTMMAKDTLGLMDALNIPRAHIVGHSMGGCIAQQIAITAPHRVNKLVVACSRTKISVIANMIFSMRETLQIQGVPITTLAEYVLPFLFSEQFLKSTTYVNGFIQWTANNPNPQSLMGYQHQLHAVKTHDISDKIEHIIAPTLVLAGEEDIVMPAKHAEAFAASLKNGRFMAFQQCAHMPHVEYPKEFAETVLRFLSLSV